MEPCTSATKAFYDEVKYYDYNNPGFSQRTGHFTQVIELTKSWKKSAIEKILELGKSNWTNQHSNQMDIRYSQLLRDSKSVIARLSQR